MKKIFFAFLASILIAARSLAATVTLAWDPSPSAGVTAYKLYEAVGTGTFGLAATLSGTTITRTVTGTTRYYVTAYDGTSGLESIPSNVIAYTPPVPPQPPSNLRVTTVTASTINLRWDPVDPATTTLVQVERTQNPNVPLSPISSVPSVVSEYLDGGVRKNKTYYYRARASGPGGVSGYSNTIAATTLK